MHQIYIKRIIAALSCGPYPVMGQADIQHISTDVLWYSKKMH